MKLRKILGLALCASIFSFGAMSCSDDDNKDNGNDVSVTDNFDSSLIMNRSLFMALTGYQWMHCIAEINLTWIR